MKLPQQEATLLDYLYKGLTVDIVLKQDQKTMTLTRGKINHFLTSKPRHPRGIKVMLEKKNIQRLYDSSPYSKQKDVIYNGKNPEQDFVGRVQRVHYPSELGILILDSNGGPIDRDLYGQFMMTYKQHSVYLFNEHQIDFLSFERYIDKIEDNIDIVLYKNVKQLFFNHLYPFIQRLEKKINVYTLEDDGSLIHLITGRKKKNYYI